MATVDGFGQHPKNRPVFGWYPAGDPGGAVKINVRDGLAVDLADNRSRVSEGERLGTGERVLGTGMGIRIGQGRGRDGGDVLGVDEGGGAGVSPS